MDEILFEEYNNIISKLLAVQQVNPFVQLLKVHLTADFFIRRNKSTFVLNCSSEKIF